MFGVQVIYDNINQLNYHLSTFITDWTQELPVNYTQWYNINKITLGNNLIVNKYYTR